MYIVEVWTYFSFQSLITFFLVIILYSVIAKKGPNGAIGFIAIGVQDSKLNRQYPNLNLEIIFTKIILLVMMYVWLTVGSDLA